MVSETESFLTAVEKGLKLVVPTGDGSATALMKPTPSSSYSSLMPTAPIIYAADCLAGQSALVPLQIRCVSVKVFAEASPDPSLSSIVVQFKTRCLVQHQHSGSALTLAVPAGIKGTLVKYEMKVLPFGSISHGEELHNCKPLSGNLYLVSLPPVEVSDRCGTLVDVVVYYIQSFIIIEEKLGLYSYNFSIPLSIPRYVTLDRMENLTNQKIRVILECSLLGIIKDCNISSHDMEGITTKEKMWVFLKESDDYSSKDLNCSFQVTSMPMDEQLLFCHQAMFIRAVEGGLKLMSGCQELQWSSDAWIPSAPVMYATVSEINALNIETAGAGIASQLPVLLPLQMTSLSVKVEAQVDYQPKPVHVRFKGQWSVNCLKKGITAPLVLAIPVGEKGCLIHCEFQVLCDGQVTRAEEFSGRSAPQIQNLCLVALPSVKGGADVCIQFCYVQDALEQQGDFSFTIPLSVPEYGQMAGKSPVKEKIRLAVQCKDTRTITKCDVPSHPMKELISDQKMRVLRCESLAYSSKDLTCSFTAT